MAFVHMQKFIVIVLFIYYSIFFPALSQYVISKLRLFGPCAESRLNALRATATYNFNTMPSIWKYTLSHVSHTGHGDFIQCDYFNWTLFFIQFSQCWKLFTCLKKILLYERACTMYIYINLNYYFFNRTIFEIFNKTN